jgi:hypothetical protein
MLFGARWFKIFRIFFIIKDPKSSGYLNPCHVNILVARVKRTKGFSQYSYGKG